jgi:hypothetical protein
MPIRSTSSGLVFASALALFSAAPPDLHAACGDGTLDEEELCVSGAAKILPGSTWVRTVLSVDVDLDGIEDVVAITLDRVYVRLGTATGLGAWSFVQFPLGTVDLRDVAAGDFDGDLDLDLAVADAMGNRVYVLRKMPGAVYAGWGNFFMGAATTPTRIFASPLTLDALADLVVFTPGIQAVRVLYANGVFFMPGGSYPVGSTPDIAMGDVDADGHEDLLYVNGFGTSTQLLVRLNFYGPFGTPIASPLPLFDPVYGPLSPLAIVAGDFDADGDFDAAVSATWAHLAPAVGAGDGTFAFQPLATTWASANRLRASDVDQNGTLDVLAPHMASDVYSVQFGDGTGAFPNPYATSTLPAGSAPTLDVAMGDFSGDGVADVLVGTDFGVQIQRTNP